MIDLLRRYNSDINEQRLSDHKPLVILPCGYPGHGKTTFLASLCFLVDRLPRRLPGFTIQPADTHTRKYLPWFIEKFRNRSLEDATSVAEIPPFVCAMNNLPSSGGIQAGQNRLVAFFDVAGEAIRAGSSHADLLHEPLLHCHVPWLVFNLGSKTATERTTSLLDSYVHLMTSKGLSLQGKRIVLVYSCTDLLVDKLPTEVADYLYQENDFDLNSIDSGTARPFNLTEYMKKAEQISNCLKEFTVQNIHDGPALISLANSYGIDLRFCATSATGHLAINGEMFEDPIPRRVIDPLLWSLFEQPEAPVNAETINVMIQIDCCKDLLNRNMMAPLLQELNKSNPLEVYYLGRTRPERLSGAGNTQLQPPTESYPSLLMPLLENVASHGRKTIVITKSAITDSDDVVRSKQFAKTTQWIVTDEEKCCEFDDAILLGSSADIASIVRHVISRFKQS